MSGLHPRDESVALIEGRILDKIDELPSGEFLHPQTLMISNIDLPDAKKAIERLLKRGEIVSIPSDAFHDSPRIYVRADDPLARVNRRAEVRVLHRTYPRRYRLSVELEDVEAVEVLLDAIEERGFLPEKRR